MSSDLYNGHILNENKLKIYKHCTETSEQWDLHRRLSQLIMLRFLSTQQSVGQLAEESS